MRYTFGTDDIAARRLQKVAEVFNPLSKIFLREQADGPVGTALDLGCGPGFTTHMLFMEVSAEKVYGMDLSDDFLTAAMDSFSECVFVRHNLIKTPFPVHADLMYGRFVLAHLPLELVNRWAGELDPGGKLLIEEMEDIETEVEVFKRYLAINRGLVASQGADLYAGAALAKRSFDREMLVNECVHLPVRNCDAAALFYPNTVSVWKREDYILDTVPESERKDISAQLLRIMHSQDKRNGIVWKMRRIAVKNEQAAASFPVPLCLNK